MVLFIQALDSKETKREGDTEWDLGNFFNLKYISSLVSKFAICLRSFHSDQYCAYFSLNIIH